VYASIGKDDERWVVNSAQDVFRWERRINNWEKMPGKVVSVHAVSPRCVVAANAGGEIYRWNGSNWDKIMTEVLARSFAATKHHMWAVHRNDGSVWHSRR